MKLLAHAKLNLCLYLGPTRADGLHEIRSLLEPLALADELEVLERKGGDGDLVVCPGVEQPDLAARALAALRARGWSRPPLRIEVDKRIPIAAGLGGGSADAAAVLRLARQDLGGIAGLAFELGADVPSQLDPRFALVGGAGERVEPLTAAAEHGIVVVPARDGLSTAEVYVEADRLGMPRSAAELNRLEGRIRAEASTGESPLAYLELLVNDLQPAALSLRPQIVDALEALERAGAARALVAGSGPTAFGVFETIEAAERAAGELGSGFDDVIATGPAGRELPGVAR